MNALNRKALGGLLRFLISLMGLVFLPAWTLDYWQGWLFLVAFFGSSLAITLHVMKHDPRLLERRLRAGPRAEKEKSQKVIQLLATILFIVSILFPVIDHRFGWSPAPAKAVIGGDFLIALGFLIVFLVFRENTFASATIEVAAQQKVVSTGPYALVRHPMYSGAIVMLSGVPLALGSWWGLATVVPFTAMLVWRLRDEEKLLEKSLPGYNEYRTKVKYRLAPRIW